MTEQVCPICKGEGTYLKISKANGVTIWGEDDIRSCWMCNGTGRVVEAPVSNRMHIRKYWAQGSHDGRIIP